MPSSTTTRSTVTLAVIAALAAGCGAASGSSDADVTPVAGTEVAVVDNDFEPQHLEVAAGGTVTWAWQGRAPHDVVGDGFDSGVQTDGTFSHSFDEPGSYDYECTLHRGMTGTVTVTAS